MSGGLKFTVKYSRKVQPWNYENIVFGLEMEYYRRDFYNINECFKEVRDIVETQIDRRLQELFAEEQKRNQR